MRNHRLTIGFCAFVLLIMTASRAPALDTEPKQILLDTRLIEINSSLQAQIGVESLIIPDGKIHGVENYDMWMVESKAWIGLPKMGSVPQMVLAHDLAYFNFNLGGDKLELIDQRVSVAANIGQFHEWNVNASAGFGYAGDLHYGDGNGYFGTGSIIGTRQVDKHAKLSLGLYYDGNASVFPDIPLPVIAYQNQVSDTFKYQLGFPQSNVVWKPDSATTFQLDYEPFTTIHANIDHQITSEISIFGGYHNRWYAFTPEGIPGNERLLFHQQRLEAGFKWQPCKCVSVVVAGGYAFDQTLEEGFDARDSDVNLRLGNEPYVRLMIILTPKIFTGLD